MINDSESEYISGILIPHYKQEHLVSIPKVSLPTYNIPESTIYLSAARESCLLRSPQKQISPTRLPSSPIPYLGLPPSLPKVEMSYLSSYQYAKKSNNIYRNTFYPLTKIPHPRDLSTNMSHLFDSKVEVVKKMEEGYIFCINLHTHSQEDLEPLPVEINYIVDDMDAQFKNAILTSINILPEGSSFNIRFPGQSPMSNSALRYTKESKITLTNYLNRDITDGSLLDAIISLKEKATRDPYLHSIIILTNGRSLDEFTPEAFKKILIDLPTNISISIASTNEDLDYKMKLLAQAFRGASLITNKNFTMKFKKWSLIYLP